MQIPISGKYNFHPVYGPDFRSIRNDAVCLAEPEDDDVEFNVDPSEIPESKFGGGCTIGLGADCGIKSETGRCCGPVLRLACQFLF